jgi:hypothetical protein
MNAIEWRRDENHNATRSWNALVGCLTARRRNDPKQAGLSIQCPADRTVPKNARSVPLPSGWILMMRAIK